jgi:hypothetical protein
MKTRKTERAQTFREPIPQPTSVYEYRYPWIVNDELPESFAETATVEALYPVWSRFPSSAKILCGHLFPSTRWNVRRRINSASPDKSRPDCLQMQGAIYHSLPCCAAGHDFT